MERRESFQERRKRQQARRRLLGKLAAVLIGAVFLFGLCKKTADQFLLTGEKKQDSYIGIEGCLREYPYSLILTRSHITNSLYDRRLRCYNRECIKNTRRKRNGNS